MRRRVLVNAAACLLVALPVHDALAQARRESTAPNTEALDRARRLLAGGDSARALRELRAATEKDSQNGPLWFEYGSLLSALTRPHWRKAAMPNGVPAMIIAAESSLAVAMRLSPDSVHYAIAYGHHLWMTNSTSMRAASKVQRGALAQLEGGTDSSAMAFVADQLGIMLWRRFETLIGVGTPLTEDHSDNRMNRQELILWIKENHRPPKTMYGIAPYEEALHYFRIAREAEPDNELYFRHEAMALAERKRWDELVMIARTRLAERPRQPWPWLVLGIAQQRLGRFDAARAALDSGYARLQQEDRLRLTSIQKLMQQKRAKWYDSLPADAKAGLGELFWNTANPSMLLPGNPVYDEFRSRVTYAELRFTDDERGRPGANSAKGEIYIRYGPPDVVLTNIPILRHIQPKEFDYHQSWVYYTELMVFTFGQNLGYGTAFQTKGSRTDFDSLRLDKPATFTNLPIMRYGVDSVSTQIARFRAPGDSMDVAVFAGVRTGALRKDSPLDSSTLRFGAFFVDALGRQVSRTTGTFVTGERDTLAMLSQQYFMRTPSTVSAVRVEALEPDLQRTARSITDVSGFANRGFGTSDLLVAAKIVAPVSKDSARWTDYAITPFTANVVPRGAPLDMLWESYEPGAVNGKTRLRFSVRVQRETNSGLVAVASRVIGGIREALTGARNNSEVTFTYEREAAAQSVLVDYLRLEVGRLEPGRYRVSLTATDVVGNATIERVQRFVVPSK